MNPGDLFEHKGRVFTLTNVECGKEGLGDGWAYAVVAFCLTPEPGDGGMWWDMAVNRAGKPDPVMLTRH